MGDGGGTRSFVESYGVVAVVDGSDPGTGLTPFVSTGDGRLPLEPRDSLRERPLVEDFIDAASDLSTGEGMTADEFVGLLSLSLLDEILLRMDPRIDLVDPIVSDFEIGKVLPSGAEEPDDWFPLSPERFEGCWPIICRGSQPTRVYIAGFLSLSLPKKVPFFCGGKVEGGGR